MRKIIFAFMLCCLLLTGCQSAKEQSSNNVQTNNDADNSANSAGEFNSQANSQAIIDSLNFSCPDCNVILISIDALRANHLGTYGYYRNTSRNIDALAEQSFVFESAYDVVPQTKPSTTSVLFGLYPYNTGIRANVLQVGPPKNTNINLPSQLKKEGYVSAAFVANPWLYANESGLDKYFDYYYPAREDKITKIVAENLSNQATKWLEKNKGQKFFMWIHYMDPHVRYEPPQEYRNVFESENIDMININEIQPYNILTPAYTKGNMTDANYYRDQYDNEIFYTDEMFGRLMNEIESLGLKNNTIIIVTADHGESLGEHATFGHIDYYDVTNRIPLIVYLPNYGGRRIDALASNIDLFPTIMSLLNINVPKHLDGVSLVPALTNRVKVRNYVFTEFYDPESNKSRDGSVTDGSNSLIVNEDKSIECYDLIKDSGEINKKGCTKEKYENLSSYLMAELKKSGNDAYAYAVFQNGTATQGNKKGELLKSLNYIAD